MGSLADLGLEIQELGAYGLGLRVSGLRVWGLGSLADLGLEIEGLGAYAMDLIHERAEIVLFMTGWLFVFQSRESI